MKNVVSYPVTEDIHVLSDLLHTLNHIHIHSYIILLNSTIIGLNFKIEKLQRSTNVVVVSFFLKNLPWASSEEPRQEFEVLDASEPQSSTVFL